MTATNPKADPTVVDSDDQGQGVLQGRRFPALKISALLLGVSLPICLSDCGLDPSGDCAPHHEATIGSPDGRHVAERWVSVCGFPGATVTDLISVTDRPIAHPPWDGVFAFNEEAAEREQVSASWIDDHKLQITISTIGDVRDSPSRIGDVAIVYLLGPGADIPFAEARRDVKVEERRQLERLKTSASWHYVESDYDFDAHLIYYYQKYIDWAKSNTTTQP